MMAPPMVVTEDTPPDMLAGSMDLCVVLPDGLSLNMSVDRSTPMMDLLVQVTTANKISPAGYILKPHNDRGPLPYKPSTPIGALDAWTIHVVPKLHTQCNAVKRPLKKTLNQPFEQTFRLQVHLPRNQLYVARVSPRTRLADILLQVCAEKNLDPIKYSLRHPSNLDQVLNVSCSLADYKLQEVTLVSNRSRPVEVSAVDIMSLQRDNNNPAYRNNLCEGSVSSGSLEGRSLSPAPSDESSASPPPPPPSRPIRKRRPAPKPPIAALKPPVEEQKPQLQVQTNSVSCSTMTTTTIHHSRNSSDSSGYHEASVLSESPQTNGVAETMAQRKMAAVDEATPHPSSLQQAAAFPSTTSLSSITGRKKKSAPPPPTILKNRASSLIEDMQRTPSVSSTASSTTTLDGNEGVTGFKSATLPPSSRLNCVSPPYHSNPLSTPQVSPAPRSCPRPVSALLESASARPRHTKCLAPQPLPRTMAPSKSSDDCNRQNKQQQSLEECPKQQPILSDSPIQKSVFSSHKACIAEMAFTFDRRGSTVEYSMTNEEIPEISTEKEPILETIVSKPLENYSVVDDSLSIKDDKATVTTAWVKGSISETDGTVLDTMADEEIDRIFTNATKNHTSPEIDNLGSTEVNFPKLPTPPPSIEATKQASRIDESVDWEYRLPAPPTFRDEARSPSVTDFGTVTIGHLEDVLCSDIAQDHKVNDELKKNIGKINCVTPDGDKVKECKNLNYEIKNFTHVSVCESTASREDDKPDPVENKSVVKEIPSRTNNLKKFESNVMKELTSTLSRQSSKADINNCTDTERTTQELTTSSTLDNFKITTYKDTKPVEVFEDDSIKSSTGEKRDKSKDDAMFRAPKARVKEPHLSRTSSFNVDNSRSGPLIKRSVSYVSLLAANVPRHSTPYRAMLQQQRNDGVWPRLRKTTSELNIDKQDETLTESVWQDDSTDLQSVQVLRKILSQSHANLSNLSEPPSVEQKLSDHQIYDEKLNDALGEEANTKEWSRSKSDDVQDFGKQHRNEPSRPSEVERSKTLHYEYLKPCSTTIRGPPAINLSTWSERPKCKISIKNDSDYISGSGKKNTSLDENSTETPESEPSTDFNRSVQVELVDNFKQDAKSKSTSDLSRIPIVRSVELKKPFTAQHIYHTPLKPVQTLEDINGKTNEVNYKTQSLKINIEEENFVGVNSLARRFGVPQKRPVSMYSSSSNLSYLANNNDDSSTRRKNSFSQQINNKCIVNETRNTDNKNVLVDSKAKANGVNYKDTFTTSGIKVLSKKHSGGLVNNNTDTTIVGSSVTSDYNRSTSCTYLSSDYENSQYPVHQKSMQQMKMNSASATVNSNRSFATLSQPNNLTQRLSTPGAYLCQSQTVVRRERLTSLQPVVKGFRTAGESKNVSSLPLQTKDLSSQSDLCKKINLDYPHKASYYNRELSTPNISSTSSNNKDSTKEAVAIKPSSSNDIVSEAVGRVPPAPPMMPVLKPIGERKGVKLLPPPEAKPRDQLMESIRGFGIHSLKKASTKYSAPLYL